MDSSANKKKSQNCQERDQLIMSGISLFESMFVPEAHPEWTIIIYQYCMPDMDVKAGKNSLGRKAISHTCDALKVCQKSHQLL